MAQTKTGFQQSFSLNKVKEFASKNAIVLVLLFLVVVIGIIRNSFWSVENLINILMISSVRMIIALGEGPIIMTKGVDLSAGRVVGLGAVIAASMLQRPDYVSRMYMDFPVLPVILPILAAMAAGLVVGLINGTIVAYLKVPPMIATLGTMVAVYGIALIYVDRPPQGAMPIGGLREDFTNIGTNSLVSLQGSGAPNWISDLRLPYLIIIGAIVVVIMWVLLNKTRLGKNIYAVGANPEAANVSGVSSAKTLLFVYTIAGVLYGLAGVLLSARSGGANATYGQMYELDAIAACVIGGVSTNGGVGSVGGILTGVLIFQVIDNGLAVLGVNPNMQLVVKGIIIVMAVAIDIRKYLRKR